MVIFVNTKSKKTKLPPNIANAILFNLNEIEYHVPRIKILSISFDSKNIKLVINL
jgi:hypothetical protein